MGVWPRPVSSSRTFHCPHGCISWPLLLHDEARWKASENQKPPLGKPQGRGSAILCRCQPAKSIRSWERARRGWEKKLKQEKSTTKMGLRGSDTSPRRDAVWPQLYSASYIYTEEREKDKTVNIFFLVDLYILQTVTRNLESMWNGTLLLFLTPDNISLCVRSLHRTPGACSK